MARGGSRSRGRGRGGERRNTSAAPWEGRALAGLPRAEDHPDGEWMVRRVGGSASERVYRCPGCNQELSARTPHVVAWPSGSPLGACAAVEQRRHWHTPCWAARSRRRPL